MVEFLDLSSFLPRYPFQKIREVPTKYTADAKLGDIESIQRVEATQRNNRNKQIDPRLAATLRIAIVLCLWRYLQC